MHHASRTLFQGDRLASRLQMSYGAMESLIEPSNSTFPQLCVNPPILSVFRPSPLLVGLEWRPASPPMIYFMSRMCRFELTVDFVFFPALLVDDRVVPGVSVASKDTCVKSCLMTFIPRTRVRAESSSQPASSSMAHRPLSADALSVPGSNE